VTLLRKFAILLGLLASTIVVGLGAAFVFGVVLEREVSDPFRATTGVLTDLARLKRTVGRIELDIADGAPPDRLAPDLERVLDDLSTAERNPRFDDLVGPTSSHNLAARVQESTELTRAWIGASTDEAAREARATLFSIHELIEAIEQRILADAGRSADFGDEMRRLHHVTLFAGMLASALFGLLAIMLLRRWVLAPVATLAEATERIASGDFAHRVHIAGRDELAMLGQQVNSMAGAIATMQSEAVERERLAAVGEMVRRLAHNLRNPLAGIRNLAELSSMRSTGDPAVKELQGEIISAVDRFNNWLKELLNVTSPMRVNLEDHEVGPWLEAIVAAHGPLARMRSVELVRAFEGAPERARFDPRHLEHAVVAILTNAIQVSPPGSAVRVSAAVIKDQPDWWEIVVRDEGPGIPEDAQDKIFRPYFTTKRDGNGIGLAVALQAVRQHGGRIDLWTQPGRGTHFSVRLPSNPEIQNERQEAAESNRLADKSQPEQAR
jgi:signal transduction histidine kinase